MCYYKGMRVTRQMLLDLLEIEKQDFRHENPYTVQSGFLYKNVDVIVPGQDCKWQLDQMEWGFIPEGNKWPFVKTRADVEKMRKGYKDEKGIFHKALTTLNAKGEELLLPGKMFRQAALTRRCLIPATDIYEFRHVYPIGKKGLPLKTPETYPYRIGVKNEEVFFMAGIHETWTDMQTGEIVESCAIVTTKANELMRQIHNSRERMPVILPPDLAGEWINTGLSQERIQQLATYQIAFNKMEAYSVSKDFKTATDALEPFVYEGLSEISA